ncbi:Integral membrane protein YggT involved in response to extracytoplasmic stress (osmotic shock) [Salmonella enterica subsp. enterica]|uniref:Integral membrane protein YggT involved in response to extracytoplasmic stress (Osmotic shock) n=1 Tax=Salmonella enterica I TaxID=59201 RepID=A0A379VLG5_SALET|nr:Integral membrane protein YggT involved in response to extracytoplasmic stress (osmotic shock) [Salmonella enterica subsp. enterica]
MNTLTFLLSTVIELYTMVLLLRVWMQWARCDFYNPFSQFVVKITQPIIGPLRRIIPANGGRLTALPCWWRLFLALLRR